MGVNMLKSLKLLKIKGFVNIKIMCLTEIIYVNQLWIRLRH